MSLRDCERARAVVTLKLATSLDGRIATGAGESQWITGREAREQVHRMRAAHDAVLVGSGTVLADDPALTVRLAGYEGRQPLRCVADRRGRTPGGAKILDESAPSLIVDAAEPSDILARICAHLQLLGRGEPGQRLGVFLEGGGQLAAAFLRAGLVDRLEWFRAPMVLGAEGLPALGDLEVEVLAGAPRFARVALRGLGDDVWESYLVRASGGAGVSGEGG